MATAWSNIIADWQGVDNEPTAGSNNLVNSGGVAEKLSELEGEIDALEMANEIYSLNPITEIYSTIPNIIGKKYIVVHSDAQYAKISIDLATDKSSAFITTNILNQGILEVGDNIFEADINGEGYLRIYSYQTYSLPNGLAIKIYDDIVSLVLANKDKLKNAIMTYDTIKINLGEELLTQNAQLLVGFSGSLTGGYTYDGTTDNGRLRFLLSSSFSTGKSCIVEFDCSYTAGECVSIGFSGTTKVDYKTLCYNGNTHIIVPLTNNSDGTYFNFWSENKVQFTITNISVKQIVEHGEEKILDVKTLLSPRNTNNLGFWNVILGAETMTKAIGSTRTIAIGDFVLGALDSGHRNIGIGTFAMSQMKGGENNISIGADSMLAVKNAHDCVAIGKSAMYAGTDLNDNIAIGAYALSGAGSSNSNMNVAIGKNSAISLLGVGNTMIGHQAGYRLYQGAYNTLIGFNALGRPSGTYNICIGNNTEFADNTHNSIVIGRAVKSTKSNQIILGGAEITEVILAGNKKLIFRADGSVTWEQVTL